jgi:hypothetical protein
VGEVAEKLDAYEKPPTVRKNDSVRKMATMRGKV